MPRLELNELLPESDADNVPLDPDHSDDASSHGTSEGDHAHEHDYLDQDTLLHHVEDGGYFEYSTWMTLNLGSGKLELPQPLITEQPIIGKEGEMLLPMDLKVTKYMVIEVMVAIVLMAVFIPLARKIQSGGAPKGRLWNLIETLLVYVRNEVAIPSIGKKEADKYVPYLWTVFFFVLFCNLFGLIPFLGSPTGALGCTTILALSTFLIVFYTGFKEMGVFGFFKAQVPHMDLPIAMAIFIVPMIFVIEVMGLFIKHFVLALRLFANMFAGHLVLAVLLAFIGATWGTLICWFITPVTLGACVAVYMLEIFVAFLQAFIFTLLSALFIGAAAHPH